jgi:hypothetical protein
MIDVFKVKGYGLLLEFNVGTHAAAACVGLWVGL